MLRSIPRRPAAAWVAGGTAVAEGSTIPRRARKSGRRRSTSRAAPALFVDVDFVDLANAALIVSAVLTEAGRI
jgi:hypothetical protein